MNELPEDYKRKRTGGIKVRKRREKVDKLGMGEQGGKRGGEIAQYREFSYGIPDCTQSMRHTCCINAASMRKAHTDFSRNSLNLLEVEKYREAWHCLLHLMALFFTGFLLLKRFRESIFVRCTNGQHLRK